MTLDPWPCRLHPAHGSRSLLPLLTFFHGSLIGWYMYIQVHRRDEVVDLGEIFGRQNNGQRYHRRTSSGLWNVDRLMSPEERSYKRKMGFE